MSMIAYPFLQSRRLDEMRGEKIFVEPRLSPRLPAIRQGCLQPTLRPYRKRMFQMHGLAYPCGQGD